MDKKLILSKIKDLLSSTVKLKDFEVDGMLLQVEGDSFEVGQEIKISTEDGFIPAGISLDGVHLIGNEQITVENGFITEVGFVETEAVTEELSTEIELQSFTDYPESVKNAAQSVLDYTAENGWGDCGTDVGKQRANQLAKGEPISLETIQRMYSYLSRHKVDLETSTDYETGCGKLMYDSWGGETALDWAKSKLESEGALEMQIDKEEENNTMLKMTELEERITALEAMIEGLSKDVVDSKDAVTEFSKVLNDKPASKLEDFKTETNAVSKQDPLSLIRSIRSKK